MQTCNECKNLSSVVEGKGEAKHIKVSCTKHKIDVRLTSKIVKDYIIPCNTCNGKDYK